ncbi:MULTISPECIES: enoyl-CoA hydratase/isomerase family protein [Amycolatopsis]|uniref:enoyl-CoA hydratase/isomerase family protein n=1 Tax=Amycolatopsis TaxID=1813 RepID=UPI001E33B910|nr:MULTISPECIES: enoyl-CoA hydratase/isomerase family protein [Amycolatopsis]
MTPEVLTVVRDGIGWITLNRPRAINALTHAMLRAIDDALTHWESDERVRAVVIDGAGERGLCAGGDIRSIYDDARAGGTSSLAFWADEYRLNAHIARYPKPYVALMDGLVLGGGVGVSAHGSLRVVTERSRVGMPETGIGFCPDIGGTHLLSRTPGELGTHAALTGAHLSGADAIHCGLADFFVPSERLEDLRTALATQDPRDAVTALAQTPPESALAADTAWIDACYAADTVEEILDRLHETGNSATAKEVLAKSPTALKVTLRALRTARTLPSLEAALMQEYRIVCASLTAPDLTEGIRAQVIDKDRNPRWSPATLDEVTPALVDRFFTAPAHGDLAISAPNEGTR